MLVVISPYYILAVATVSRREDRRRDMRTVLVKADNKIGRRANIVLLARRPDRLASIRRA